MKLKRTVTAVAVFVLFTFIFNGCGADENVSVLVTDSSGTMADTETEISPSTPGKICVYVCGAIQSPGVYYFSEDARICDAIESAGGFTEDAALQYLNQAELLTDAERIYVPTIEEAYALSGDGEDGESTDQYAGITEDGLVNINYADEEELMTISGIGETRAAAIIAYRRENGLFSSIDEIVNVSGIGDTTFSKIKPYITVN